MSNFTSPENELNFVRMAVKKSFESPDESMYVVGIGASAGGLEAINHVLSNVPLETGFAFIIVQHLSPDYKSLMAELLAKYTHMRVIEVTKRMKLEPNCVYLLPSKTTLTVSKDTIIPKEKDVVSHPHHTIDTFFESLGNEYKERSVGIILSGTGSDGSRGVTKIAEKGGIVIVQDPATAAFDGMPNSAITTGVVNMVLPPETMVPELLEYVRIPASARSIHLNSHSDDVVLNQILLLIKRITGSDFTHYKNPTLVRRISKRMAELNQSSLPDYLDYLNRYPKEVKLLSQEFLINVTHFFRDPEAFEILQKEVIPNIFKDKKNGDQAKVWVVACSTGEEAYSVAILCHEYLQKEQKDISLKIFATDIDKDALEIAGKGIYPRSILESVTGQRIANFFDVEGSGYRIKPEIRKTVVFSQHDILRDPPFGRMDLITCRNMLIYINTETQKDILRKMHFALNLNGYLFVGPSEHVDVIKPALQEVSKKWRIYKCISKARMFEQTVTYTGEKILFGKTPQELRKFKNPMNHLGEIFMDTLLEDSTYAGIFVDLNLDVKNAIGNYRTYLNFPETQFNFSLPKLLQDDLAIMISASARKAIQENRTFVMREVKWHVKDEVRVVDIHIKPFLLDNNFAQQFLFIVIKETKRLEVSSDTKKNRKINDSRVQELERELKETRENLQAVIEEMEATNEELQSSNEEMISTNEELQSANEELQSLNEELHTVSVEHQLKIKELMELNDDMNNYFRNSESGQILVDKKLIIRKFTPSVTRMINLIPSDVNRSLIDITTKFPGNDFITDITNVIRLEVPIDKEISIGNRTYLMRISSYERADKKIDGVVITFTDISRIKQLDTMLEAVFKAVPNAILASRAIRNERKEIVDFEFISVNAAAEKALGFSRKEVVGNKLKNVFGKDAGEMLKMYKQVVDSGKTLSHDFYNDQLNVWGNIVLVKFLDGVLSVATDITEKKKAADLVEKNYEELRKTLKLRKG